MICPRCKALFPEFEDRCAVCGTARPAAEPEAVKEAAPDGAADVPKGTSAEAEGGAAREDRGPLRLLGWIVGAVAGPLLGLAVLIPLLGCVVGWAIARSLTPKTSRRMLPAVGLHAGVVLWLSFAILYVHPAESWLVWAEVIILTAGTVTLAVRPHGAVVAFLCLLHGLAIASAVVRLDDLTNPSVGKALAAIVLVRTAAAASAGWGWLQMRADRAEAESPAGSAAGST